MLALPFRSLEGPTSRRWSMRDESGELTNYLSLLDVTLGPLQKSLDFCPCVILYKYGHASVEPPSKTHKIFFTHKFVIPTPMEWTVQTLMYLVLTSVTSFWKVVVVTNDAYTRD